MRRLVAILALVLTLPAGAHAQDQYAAILLQYLSGDADAALAKLARLSYGEMDAGIEAFDTTRSRQILTGAAAMHTEAALRRGSGAPVDYHLRAATAIVEFGEPPGAKTNTLRMIRPRFAQPVPDDFRRLWYCTVINWLEGTARLPLADRYLAHALAFYPDNPDIHMLAGIAQEMHGSPRVVDSSAGERRRALTQAAQQYRAVATAAPDRVEARLRLARVLQQLGKGADARPLLVPLTAAADDRVAYLASLFLGGIEDEEGHAASAETLYDRAAARAPSAQTARLAASELRHRRGDRQAAADVLAASSGEANTFDPWWTYVFGEYWRTEILLDAIRQQRRA